MTIPLNIREKVIEQWLKGQTRERIAEENDIGTETVTEIVKQARAQEEYRNIGLLWRVSIILEQEGIESSHVGFAIRLRDIMNENGLNEDQLELIIRDFVTASFKRNLSFNRFISSIYEVLNLESKLNFPVDKTPMYIIEGKKTLKNLEIKHVSCSSKIKTTTLIRGDLTTFKLSSGLE